MFYILLRLASMYSRQHKQPVENIIDGNVLSYIPDNFQGATEIVSDRLPKAIKSQHCNLRKLN